MLRKLLFRLTARLKTRLINREDHPYLERYFVGQKWGFTCYLHRFVGNDPDESVHNHPWHAVAICLAGGYTEQRMKTLCPVEGWTYKLRHIRPGSINIIRNQDFHQIVALKKETWTLFIHHRYLSGWGFLRRVPCGHNCETHDYQVVFHQPLELMRSPVPWWLRPQTPIGKDSHREPSA